PLVLEAREQVALSEVDGLLEPPVTEQGVELAHVNPQAWLLGQSELVARDVHGALRSTKGAPERPHRAAKAGPSARVHDVRQEDASDLVARMPPRREREPSKQRPGAPAGGRLERDPVPLDAHRPQQPDPEHLPSLPLPRMAPPACPSAGEAGAPNGLTA